MLFYRFHLFLLIFGFLINRKNVLTGGINRPVLCPNVKWNSSEFVDYISNASSLILTSFFIDEKNQIFLGSNDALDLTIYSLKYNNNTRISLDATLSITSFYRIASNEIYFSTKGNKSSIYVISSDFKTTKPLIETNETCWSLFVVKNSKFYCSLRDSHQVIVYSREGDSDPQDIYGEERNCNSSSTTFCFPSGILVLEDTCLYVADTNNDRIQRFCGNQTEGKTFIGHNGEIPFKLSQPSDITMDGSNNFWITQFESNRIHLCSKTKRCECAIECEYETKSSIQNQFYPSHITLDRYGNLFVLEQQSNQIKKYYVERNTCYVYRSIDICENSTWNETGETIADHSKIGYNARAIFIDHENQIYVANHFSGQIIVWKYLQKTPDRILCQCVSVLRSICWSKCQNKVVKVSLDEPNSEITAIGTDDLNKPSGIFITDHHIYVADSDNNRIRRYDTNGENGNTVAGCGIPDGLNLSYPTDIYVHHDEEYYIADDHHHRIVRTLKNVSRVIVGMTGQNGSSANQFTNAVGFHIVYPNRNLYVLDEYNHRLQKFSFLAKNCPKISNEETTFQSTVVSTTSNVNSIVRTSCSFAPCENRGNCTDDSTFLGRFTCQCPAHTRGALCQYNDEPSEPDPCHNRGICIGTSKNDFFCHCHRNWTGRFCEIKVNFCPQKTCYNKGQCRPLIGYAICECLPGSFTGDQCEISLKNLRIFQIISKTFGYVAIIAIGSVALFLIVMDVLKYVFGIDPVAEDREQLRREKQRRHPKIEHFIYINRPEDLVPRAQQMKITV